MELVNRLRELETWLKEHAKYAAFSEDVAEAIAYIEGGGWVSVPEDMARSWLESLETLNKEGVVIWPNHPYSPIQYLRDNLPPPPAKESEG